VDETSLKIVIFFFTVLAAVVGWIVRRLHRQVDKQGADIESLEKDFNDYRLSAKDQFADRNEFRAAAAGAFKRIDQMYLLLLEMKGNPNGQKT